MADHPPKVVHGPREGALRRDELPTSATLKVNDENQTDFRETRANERKHGSEILATFETIICSLERRVVVARHVTRVDVEVAAVPAASAVTVVAVEGDAVPVVGEDIAEAVQPEVDWQLSGVPAGEFEPEIELILHSDGARQFRF